MDYLQVRLREFIDFMGISMQTFERQAGIGQGLGVRLKSNSYSTTFKRISNAFPQLNIVWLKTGEGSMLNPTPHTTNNVTGHNVCGVNVNGRDIDIKCPTEYDMLINIVNTNNEVVSRMQAQLDKAQSQIDELIALLKAKS